MNFKLVSFFYYLFLCSWILPSGSFLNIPIRALLFLVLCLLVIIKVVAYRTEIKISIYSIYLVFIVCFANLWDVLSLINNQIDCILTFNKELISLVSSVIITDIFIKNRWTAVSIIFDMFKYTSIIFIFIKILVELSLLFDVASYSQCMDNWEAIFSSYFVPGYLFIGNIQLYRIETANDFIPLIVLMYDIIFCKCGIVGKIFSTILLPTYLIIVNTRIIFIQFLVILLCLFFEKILKKRVNKKQVFCFFVVIFILILNLELCIHFYNSIVERFSHASAAVENSDFIRIEQYQYLVSGISDRILLGHGLASYIPFYLRDHVIMYKYELEYLSYIYQFGIIGFILLIGSLIYIFYRIIFNIIKCRKLKLFILLNFLFWGIRPLVNPHFLSSNSGMCIVCMYVLALYYCEKNIHREDKLNKNYQ